MKKYFNILLAFVLIMTMGISAKADNNGKLTIENTTNGLSYNIYKILDATWDGNKDKVAYTIDSTSAWFVALDDASSKTDENKPFKIEKIKDTNIYNVYPRSNELVKAWLESVAIPDTTTNDVDFNDTNSGNGADITFEGLSLGFYLITRGEEDIRSSILVKDDTANVIDKNQVPSWVNPTPEGESQAGKNVSNTANGPFNSTSTATIGDTVYFKVNAFIPNYDGDQKVYSYTFNDLLTKEFLYTADSFVLRMKKGNGDFQVINITNNDFNYSVQNDDNDNTALGLTIYMQNEDETLKHPNFGNIEIEITYNAVLTKNATFKNKNQANLSWKYNKDDDEPKTIDDSVTTTYTYGFNLEKVDEEGASLSGAEFKLYDNENNEIPVIYDIEKNYYRKTVRDETAETIKAGTAKIFGLKNGTKYFLDEVVVPDGYNKITGNVEVDFGEPALFDDSGYLNSPIKVVNLTGTQLPSTGGIGTTMFYVIGGSLMMAAAVVYVTRRRAENE